MVNKKKPARKATKSTLPSVKKVKAVKTKVKKAKVVKAKVIKVKTVKPKAKKTGPGRPPKVFVATPKPKRAGPGRPKKVIKPYMLPEKKLAKGFSVINILHAPKKDNIILLLFVISLLIFLFSIYIAILKSQNTLEQKILDNEATIVNVQTGNIPFEETEVSTGAEIPVQEAVDTKAVIIAFYDAFNQKDVKTLYALTDSHLNQTNTFLTYFTSNRLNKFLGWLAWSVKVSDIEMSIVPAQSTEVQEMTYTISYTLKDGQTFQEERSALLIKKWESYKIWKLMCETTGCSKLPFFNPGRYWIE